MDDDTRLIINRKARVSTEARASLARHKQVLELDRQGISSKEIAERFGVGKTQISNMRVSMTAWEMLGLADEDAWATLEIGSFDRPVSVFAFVTSPYRGIRQSFKTAEFQGFCRGLKGKTSDERISALVDYVERHTTQERRDPSTEPVILKDLRITRSEVLAVTAAEVRRELDRLTAPIAELLGRIGARQGGVGLSATWSTPEGGKVSVSILSDLSGP